MTATGEALALWPCLRYVFTNGLCPLLACALYAEDPDRFMLVETDPDGESWHVAVQDRSGRVWDIEGVHQPADFEARWGKLQFLRSDDQIDLMFEHSDWQGLAHYMTAPDKTLGLDAGVTDNVWSVACGLAREILGGPR